MPNDVVKYTWCLVILSGALLHDRLGRPRPTHIGICGGRTEWVQVACQQPPALLRPPTSVRSRRSVKPTASHHYVAPLKRNTLPSATARPWTPRWVNGRPGDQVGPRRTVYQAVVLVADQRMYRPIWEVTVEKWINRTGADLFLDSARRWSQKGGNCERGHSSHPQAALFNRHRGL